MTTPARAFLSIGALALACSSPPRHPAADVDAEAPPAVASPTPPPPDAPAARPDLASAPAPADAPPDAPPRAPDAAAPRPDATASTPATDGAAPGACRGTIFTDAFDGADDHGWTHTALEPKMGDPWARGTASSPTCHQGGCWATRLDGPYPNCQEAALVSPVIDLGGCAPTAMVRVSWWQWLSLEPFAEGTYFDSGLVQISRDGGATWSYLPVAPGPEPAYVGTCGTHDDGCGSPLPFVRGQRVWSDQKLASWRETHFDVPAAYLTRQFRFRFVFGSDFKMGSRGWLIDDVSLSAM